MKIDRLNSDEINRIKSTYAHTIHYDSNGNQKYMIYVNDAGGVFYLFRMSTEVYEGKGVLFFVGAILIIITFAYLKRNTLMLYSRKLANK